MKLLSYLSLLEKYALIVAGLLMAYAEIAQALRTRSWLKWGLGLMGFYWAGYYVHMVLAERFGWLPLGPHTFGRSGLLVLISLITANALRTLYEVRRLVKSKGRPHVD